MGVFATQDHVEEIFTQCSERYEITATFRFELYKYLYESEVRNTPSQADGSITGE